MGLFIFFLSFLIIKEMHSHRKCKKNKEMCKNLKLHHIPPPRDDSGLTEFSTVSFSADIHFFKKIFVVITHSFMFYFFI